MTSPFTALVAAADATMLAVMGERVELRPRGTEGRLSALPADPTRPVATVRAIYSEEMAELIEGDETRRAGATIVGSASYLTAEAHVWLTARDYAGLGYEMRRGDALALLDRPGVPIFSVSAVLRSDQGDVRLLVTREDTP